MSFEDDLRSALRHEPAPEGFAERVLAKTVAGRRVIPFWRRPATLAMAAAVIVAAVIPEGFHEYRQRERAIEARDQLVQALAITRVQLRHARGRVQSLTKDHTVTPGVTRRRP